MAVNEKEGSGHIRHVIDLISDRSNRLQEAYRYCQGWEGGRGGGGILRGNH